MFSKYIKEITIAARHGGGDPEANPRLRTAIAAAKSVNMPATNIERAIKRGTGEIEGVAYEETQYEGYAPGGVALLVEVATDNRNRTAGDVRHIFTKYGGNLGEAGSVSYLFKPRGVIWSTSGAIAEDALMELALEAGADDVNTEGDGYEVLTPAGAARGGARRRSRRSSIAGPERRAHQARLAPGAGRPRRRPRRCSG